MLTSNNQTLWEDERLKYQLIFQEKKMIDNAGFHIDSHIITYRKTKWKKKKNKVPRLWVLTREILTWLSRYPKNSGENEEPLAWSAISSDQNWHQEWNLNQIHLIRIPETNLNMSIIQYYMQIPNEWSKIIRLWSYWTTDYKVFS